MKGYDEKKDLKEWSYDEVTAWLKVLKAENRWKLDVEDVACAGDSLAAMTREDMKEIAGGPVGIHIFNAKEALLRKQGGVHQGEKRGHGAMSTSNEGVEY
eukprot:CAMPEP_0184503216 /NCGR_PEP_ID=MMETSP0113_2-20130426/51758_1 /TAXON_ID=91329 /ORGANISM="Norrisiella sphaerica, Strain BC52" /LENGTH=99 /DNA_ID=CAMNT_0026892667 /DNA_START=962 /DNA_END=1258 /DNA_ORIENTATION=-